MATFCRSAGRRSRQLLWLAVLALNAGLARAEIPPPAVPELSSLPAWAQERVAPVKRALVIGISQYQHANPLSTPAYDAGLVSQTLHRLDPAIIVTQASDSLLGRDVLLHTLDQFTATVQPGDIVLVYYSGHGLEHKGINYLVPADAELSKPGAEGITYVSIPFLIDEIKKTGAGITVVVLDACRNDPFASAAREEQLDVSTRPAPPAQPAIGQGFSVGLQPMQAPRGFLVLFAAQAGHPSFSLLKGETADQGSIFTRSLLKLLSTQNEPLSSVFNAASGDVAKRTRNWQLPFIASFNAGQVMLKDNQNLAKNELETWVWTVAGTPEAELPSALDSFIDRYPAGPFSAAARKRLAELSVHEAFAVLTGRGERDIGLLGGALKTPALKGAYNTSAYARYPVNVRTQPSAANSRILTDLKQGQQVEVLDGKTPRGWAKVMLDNGQVGYVGSVTAQDKPAEVITLGGEQLAGEHLATLDNWRASLGQERSIIEVKVGLVSDPNPTEASRLTLLRGLRARAAIQAQGVERSRVALRLASPDVPADTISISLMKESLQ